jgi:hypothetical protein
MGRQIAVNFNDDEEIEFLQFLKENADIQLIKPFAETKEGLFVQTFESRGCGNWSYYIWNTQFSWEPEYQLTKEGSPRFYISNLSTAPVLQYTRHNFEPGRELGRIYWAKVFAAPNGVSYDLSAFEVWYNKIIKWYRKKGRKSVAL